MLTESRPPEVENHGAATKNIARQRKNKRGRSRAGTTRKDREEVEVLRGSRHGVARALQAAQLPLQLQEAVLLPGCPPYVGPLP